jgi:hypothetical protein
MSLAVSTCRAFINKRVAPRRGDQSTLADFLRTECLKVAVKGVEGQRGSLERKRMITPSA